MAKCAQNGALQTKLHLFFRYTPKHPEVRHKCHISSKAQVEVLSKLDIEKHFVIMIIFSHEKLMGFKLVQRHSRMA